MQADNLNQPFDINRRHGWTSAPPPSCAPWSPIWKSSRGCTALPCARRAPRSRRRHSRSATCCRVGRRASPRAIARRPGRHARSGDGAPLFRQPREGFFTGGGLHNFANFEPKDNSRVMTVREAARNSVNLVFIRIMRDIVRHYMPAHRPAPSRALLDDASDPRRAKTIWPVSPIRKGASSSTAFTKYHKKLIRRRWPRTCYARARPTRAAGGAVFRYLEPQARSEAVCRARCTRSVPASASLSQNTLRSDVRGLTRPMPTSLADRGYLAQHSSAGTVGGEATCAPHPKADLRTPVMQASTGERQEVYDWLFKNQPQEHAGHPHPEPARSRSFLKIYCATGNAWAIRSTT